MDGRVTGVSLLSESNGLDTIQHPHPSQAPGKVRRMWPLSLKASPKLSSLHPQTEVCCPLHSLGLQALSQGTLCPLNFFWSFLCLLRV